MSLIIFFFKKKKLEILRSFNGEGRRLQCDVIIRSYSCSIQLKKLSSRLHCLFCPHLLTTHAALVFECVSISLARHTQKREKKKSEKKKRSNPEIKELFGHRKRYCLVKFLYHHHQLCLVFTNNCIKDWCSSVEILRNRLINNWIVKCGYFYLLLAKYLAFGPEQIT